MLQPCQCSVVQATDGDRGNDVLLNSKLHPSLLVPEGCSCCWGLVSEYEHAPVIVMHWKGEQPGKASAIPAIGELHRGASVQNKASTLHAAHKENSWTNNQVYLHLPFLHPVPRHPRR